MCRTEKKLMDMEMFSLTRNARLWITACIFMLVSGQLRAADTYEWTGHTVNGVASSDTLYLYNVATGYFMNQGGYWGTQPALRRVGIPVCIDTLTVTTWNGWGPNQQSTTTYYQPLIKSGVNPENSVTGYVGYVDKMNDNQNALDTARLYVDRHPTNSKYLGSCVMDFAQVSGITDATVYNISVTPTNGTTYYWTAVTDSGSLYIDLVTSDNLEAKGDSAQWILVTLDDLKAAFDATEASAASPADATFFISDQNFHRNNDYISKWSCSNNSSFSTTTGEKFYYGMGYSDETNNRLYGQYYAANIYGLESATVSQAITIERAGWYRVSCAGFYIEGSGEMTAELYAKSSDTSAANSSSSISLYHMGVNNGDVLSADTINTSGGYLAGGRLLTMASTQDKYLNYIYVYVSANSTLTIGVETTGGKGGWACFDDVELAYLGNSTEYIVLEETDTLLSYATTENGSTTYANYGINDQLTNAITYGSIEGNSMKSYTLALKRTMQDGEWNSLVLPVDLTYAMLQAAFGTDVKVAKLTGVEIYDSENQTIEFTTISTSDSLKHDSLYIIKPTGSTLTTYSDTTLTTPLPKSGEEGYTRKVSGDYYVIPQVSFPTDIVSTKIYEKEVKQSQIKAMGNDGGYIIFYGTYIKQTSRVPKGSYMIGKPSGEDATWGFYHYTGNTDLTVKGFRTWIEPAPTDATNGNADDSSAESDAPSLTFTVDGVNDPTLNAALQNGVITSIDRVSSETRTGAGTNRIYSLSGQLVREGTSTDGLAKGIYIVNGKKYIVK